MGVASAMFRASRRARSGAVHWSEASSRSCASVRLWDPGLALALRRRRRARVRDSGVHASLMNEVVAGCVIV